MKKFYDYQLEHQVRIPNNPHRLFNFDKIDHLLKDIKRLYYDNTFDRITINHYTPNSKVLEILSKETRIPLEDVIEIFSDPKYANLSQRSQVDSVRYDDPAYVKIRNDLAQIISDELDVRKDGMSIFLHVQKPGQFHALHIDFIRSSISENKNISDEPDHTKFLIFFDDWQDGQAFQINQEFIKWKSCDVLDYNLRDSQHGSANFGYEDRFLLHVIAKYK